MRGKFGIVVGFAAGYVFGTRAGRERYEQIKAGVGKLWHTEPVQKQVRKAKELTKSAAFALPSALWDGAVKVTKAASKGTTPGQKLDAALIAADDSADEVALGARISANEAKRSADKAVADIKDGIEKKAADD
ncbi:hypothetical protein [Microbacterium sp. bgisy203]|uniref:hypothetical protein n=1 Tax=Microbacterium sp. bgisy203 TaxID=3413799 RepID=UPI003D711A7E